MRRSSLSLALSSLVSALAFAGCEDGPVQQYKAAPSGAATTWNDGNTAGTADTATQGFGTQTGGNNKQEICTGSQLATRWAAMVKEPIVPPYGAGGIDMSGGVSWAGLTIDDAEKTNCQSTADGDIFGDGNSDNAWGDNGEVTVEYRLSTRKIIQINLWPGYLGVMNFHSADNAHTYQIGVSVQIQKDGQPFTYDLQDGQDTAFHAQTNEIYRALMATYQPALPPDAPTSDCLVNGHCISGSFGDAAYLYIPAMGWAIWIDNRTAPQPVPSIPTRMDLDMVKIFPYYSSSVSLKLDQEGPVAAAGTAGVAKAPCTLKMGLKYSDFLSDCIQVNGDATKDQAALNMLLAGLSHNTERFFFDAQGVDVNFDDNTLANDAIITDSSQPHPADYATEFDVDQDTGGIFTNDYDTKGNQDLHGTGAVYKEYARLVRQKLLALSGITDGDVTKCFYPVPQPAGFNPATFQASLPAYCTGFEGFITPAPPTGTKDYVNVGAKNAIAINSALATGLKLGHQKVIFCWDPNGNLSTGYQSCTSGDTFSTSYAQVLAVFGKGKQTNLPGEVQDVRFFFQQWVTAFMKYLTVAGQATVPDLSTVYLSPNDLFFDSVGAGQFETAEYVDRRFATATQPPTDITLTADVKNGIFADYVFSRSLYRGEEAIYTATLTNAADSIGKETALLTNIFGSPVLANAYYDVDSTHDAFYCATHDDGANCNGQRPPLDSTGKMLTVTDETGKVQPFLSYYKQAIGGLSTPFSLGPTPITVLQTYNTIQQAMISVPYTDPKGGAQTLTALVPWAPKQPGIGFAIAQNGEVDKFVSTSQLDLSGTTITANVDYDAVIDPQTQQPNPTAIQFKAVETSDFLGSVFLCQDANTGDLLSAQMYTSVQTILNWFDSHPGSKAACGIIIRYSPFNNYVDYITSITNGVRVNITQGGGFGRVVDVVLFVPGQ